MNGLPPGIQLDRDLAYGPDPAQRLDVYRPGAGSRWPILFFVHGGGWARGDKASAQVIGQKVAHWAGRGYLVVSVNYRLLPAARPLEQLDDVACALAFVQRAAPGWGADADACLVMGHSAGGHLATLLAVDAGIAARAGIRPWRGTVVLDTAALDLVALMRGPHLPLHDRAWGTDPAAWREGSPWHRLTAPLAAPLLLVCSEQRPRLLRQAQAFVARATELGGQAQLLPVSLMHEEINGLLGADNAYTASVDRFVRSVGLP